MPRPPHLHVPGAHYHVILRGNHREALFGSNADRQVLNEIVADVLARFGGRIHAFCWMTNHLHALLQIAEHPLGKMMQRVAMRFSRYRHRALNTTGHLFERRYKAKLVDVDAYFLTLLRYIHLNPVKARIVSDPADYPWSSHRAYLGLECLPWLTTDFSLMMFSPDLSQARSAYLRFITNDTDIEDPDTDCHPEDSRILGTDRFIETSNHCLQATQHRYAPTACQRNLHIERHRSRPAVFSLPRPESDRCSHPPRNPSSE